MEITVSEFRKDTKKYFDNALRGEAVCIERGGVHYNLTARIPQGAVIVPAPMPPIMEVVEQALQDAGEKPCCMNEKVPCKHWAWDSSTGEGWKNSLSGRMRYAL